jgi:hypothetical protein
MRRARICVALAIGGAVLSGPAAAFNLFPDPTRRPAGGFSMSAALEQGGNATSPSGTSWNDAFASAAARWNASSPLVDVVVTPGAFEDPCGGSAGLFGADFSATVCGDDFGEQTLGVALRSTTRGGLVLDGGIVFKEDGTVNWDVFDAPLASRPDDADFRRVAVHELGHLLGLAHEDDVPAIMQTFANDIVAPQTDDVNGLLALYDVDCPALQPGSAGTVTGSLGVADGDCFDSEGGVVAATLEADPGVESDSLVDLYTVTLSETTTLAAELSAGVDAFNPVVQIVDPSLATQLAAEWNGAGATAVASALLPAGDYVVVARSLFAGGGGDYTLTLTPEPAGSGAALVALAALALRRRPARRRAPADVLRR